MMYYCPQCGTKVLQGPTVCPQCGTALKFVIQTGGNNSNLNSSARTTPMKKKNAMGINSLTDDLSGFTTETGPVLKYNEFADPDNTGEQIQDNDDMSIIGINDNTLIDDYEAEFQTDKQQHDMDIQNKTVIGNISTNMARGAASGVNELSKYKIITQIFDKKMGFDAAELESKLNMYAKLGYHIVPNTMICQPGQDFFALMERTVPEVPPQPVQPQPVQPQPLGDTDAHAPENKTEESL